MGCAAKVSLVLRQNWTGAAEQANPDRCIYCNRQFGEPHEPKAACLPWAHIANAWAMVNLANIALCCVGCNASKGTKPLRLGLSAKYCIDRGISKQSMSAAAISSLAADN